MVTWPSILDWQALLLQTDCATRAVSQNLVNRCTTVGTSCTTNPEEIEVMELEDYSWPTSNKLCASSNYVSIVVSAAHTIDVDKFCWRHHRRVVAKFSKSRVCDMVPEGCTLIFRGTWMLDRSKEAPTPKPAQFVQSFRYNTGLWQTDTRWQHTPH